MNTHDTNNLSTLTNDELDAALDASLLSDTEAGQPSARTDALFAERKRRIDTAHAERVAAERAEGRIAKIRVTSAQMYWIGEALDAAHEELDHFRVVKLYKTGLDISLDDLGELIHYMDGVVEMGAEYYIDPDAPNHAMKLHALAQADACIQRAHDALSRAYDAAFS